MTDLTTLLQDLITRLFRDPEAARQFAQDPQGTLAARGITDHDLSNVNLAPIVAEAAQTASLAPETRHELADYTTHHAAHGDGGGHHSNPIDHIIHEVSRVQEIVHNESYHYESYNSFDDHSVHNLVDNSIDVRGDHNFIDPLNTTAIGDHPLIAHDIDGPVVNGPGVAVNGPVDGPIVNGPNTGVINEGSITAPVNTGTNTGIIADGPVSDAVVGDHNTALHTGDLDHSPINFGGGHIENTDLSDAHFGQGATVGVGSGSTHGGTITQDSGNISNSGNTSNSNNRTDSHDRDSHDTDSHDHIKVDSHDHSNSDNVTDVDSHDRSDSHDSYRSDSHDHYQSDNEVDSHDHTHVDQDVDVH